MAVTPEDVRRVAQLARLGIPDADLIAYVGQLNGILAHMEVLQQVEGAVHGGAIFRKSPGCRQGRAAPGAHEIRLKKADDRGKYSAVRLPIVCWPRTAACRNRRQAMASILLLNVPPSRS